MLPLVHRLGKALREGAEKKLGKSFLIKVDGFKEKLDKDRSDVNEFISIS
jgi:hypothetical protein